MNIKQLGLIADAVYATTPSVSGFTLKDVQSASGRMNGFQAATFVGDGYTIIAFRGTAQAADGIADIKLTGGMNTTYFSQGEDYVQRFSGDPNTVLCGHSLGGAIAQVVANRRQLPMVSFNAPGVAVFASNELADASIAMTAIRTAGMTLSALRHPMQAARDVRATFYRVRGINICLENDFVSKIGLHYGPVKRIRGTSSNPATEHRMTTMNQVLGSHAVGDMLVAAL